MATATTTLSFVDIRMRSSKTFTKIVKSLSQYAMQRIFFFLFHCFTSHPFLADGSETILHLCISFFHKEKKRKKTHCNYHNMFRRRIHLMYVLTLLTGTFPVFRNMQIDMILRNTEILRKSKDIK